MTSLATVVWEASQLGSLITALTRHTGLVFIETDVRRDAGPLEAVCAAHGLEAEPVMLTGETLDGQLRALPPGLVQVPGGYLGVVAVHGSTVRVLTPRLAVVRLPLAVLRDVLIAPAVGRINDEVAQLLDGCNIPARRRARAAAALVREHLRQVRLGTVWQLRVPPGVRFGWQFRHAGLRRRLLTCLGAHLAAFVLLLGAWQVLGTSVLRGQLETGWLLGWMGLLATSIPFRLLSTWSQGILAVGSGGLLKQRLLSGALRLDIDTVRQHGVGELLGRVIESDALEVLTLSGGLTTVLALSELLIVMGLMYWGAAPLLQPVALAVWLLLLGVGAYIYSQRQLRWTTLRRTLTGTLVERMAGHRTRLAQQAPAHWHADEDAELEQYLALSEALDHANVWLTALLMRGWLLVGVLTLAPVYVAPAMEPARLAVSLGCLLLGDQALRRMAGGVTQLAGAAIAWQQVAPLFHAATHRPECELFPAPVPTQAAATVLEAHHLVFDYPGRTAPVLRDCNFIIRHGESVLLEGSSGGGKSTLVAVLSGLRHPASGVLLAGGVDRATLGEAGWRRRVVAAPQYHENHILAAPLAFNLLLGRRWPPKSDDLRDAEALCHELGLGELLDRMPGGLMQMVGDTGWQLSQGERSRVFIARALLQGGALLLLDESFAALDPLNLQRCLACVLRRASTLLVVAHP